MSDCKVFRTEIDEAADGGALSAGTAAHVASCAACGAALSKSVALRGLVRGLAKVEAPSDFEYRLRARMAASKPRGGRGLFAGLFPVGGLAWAAVAVCVLSLTAAVYFRQTQPARHDASNSGEVAGVPQASASPTANESNNAGVKTNQQTNGNPTVASNQTASDAPQRVTHVKGERHVSTQPHERELAGREPRSVSPRAGAIDMAFSPAPIRLPELNSGNGGASRVPTQGIQLGTTAGTLRVVLLDERGTLVPMRTVSFGSQEPLSRQTVSGRVSAKDVEGVW